jgi:hypothetical protein
MYMNLYNIFIVNDDICKNGPLYHQHSFCISVLIYLMMALAWAETCCSIHVQVIICNEDRVAFCG